MAFIFLDKLLKKRYAVFNDNGTLAELKGFEVKRRGELKLIKIFQSQIFEKFLEGGTLEECYQAVGAVANHWLDLLYSRGTLSAKRTRTRQDLTPGLTLGRLRMGPGQGGTWRTTKWSICSARTAACRARWKTTAAKSRRRSGNPPRCAVAIPTSDCCERTIVRVDWLLTAGSLHWDRRCCAARPSAWPSSSATRWSRTRACRAATSSRRYVEARPCTCANRSDPPARGCGTGLQKPVGTPVTERAVPIVIFSAEQGVKTHYLRKWYLGGKRTKAETGYVATWHPNPAPFYALSSSPSSPVLPALCDPVRSDRLMTCARLALLLRLKDSSLRDFDIRTILDWSYYIDRLGNTIQKLITIPAAMQKVRVRPPFALAARPARPDRIRGARACALGWQVVNPVPRVRHPDWLLKRVATKDDKTRQARILDSFSALPKPAADPMATDVPDMEDVGMAGVRPLAPTGARAVVHRKRPAEDAATDVVSAGRSALRSRARKRSSLCCSPFQAPAGHGGRTQEAERDGQPPPPAPDRHVDYPAWVAFKKVEWRLQRELRRRQRQSGQGNGDHAGFPGCGVVGLRDWGVARSRDRR